MESDAQLLRTYVADGSEDAFGELLGRYVGLVYSAALRQVSGDTYLAEDIAQTVFADLARKARWLPADFVLAGWLHRATHYAAAQMRRTDRRRRAREQHAADMKTLHPEPTPDWERIRPLLDEALNKLGRTDRDAVLLRFFEQRSLKEIGMVLGCCESGASRRISRATDKLRSLLERRGVTTTAQALSVALTANAVQTVPAGLTVALITASLESASAGTASTLAILKLMITTKLKVGAVSVLIVVGVAAPLLLQQQSTAKLREENRTLREQGQLMVKLREENDLLSNQLTQAKRSISLSNEQLLDLMRLRDQVGQLRRQNQELAKQQSKPSNASATQQVSEAESEQAQVQRQRTKMEQVAAALQSFRIHHPQGSFVQDGKINASLAELAPQVHWEEIEVSFNEVSEMNQAIRSQLIRGYPPSVLARSKNPVKTADGKWERWYAFADNQVKVRRHEREDEVVVPLLFKEDLPAAK